MHLRLDTTALAELTDLELVARFQEGCQDSLQAVITRYRRFARAKARSYFLVGADHDDVEQEALIGLYKAARDFRPEHQSSFRAFAELCITRQIITAIKTATRQKHIPLNSYVSLNKQSSADDDESRSLGDVLTSAEVLDPAELLISAEEIASIKESMGRLLSELETGVLRLYMDGKSYQEIADHLGRHVKSIDNALQRIKRKLEQHLVGAPA